MSTYSSAYSSFDFFSRLATNKEMEDIEAARMDDTIVGLRNDDVFPQKPSELPTIMASHVEANGVDAHFEYFRNVYDRINEYGLVKQAKSGYNKTKSSFGLLENTLNYVENTACTAKDKIAVPVYANLGYPVADRLLGMYTRGAENTQAALVYSKNAMITTGTVGLGLAIVTTQMGLIATTYGANMILDTALFTKHMGSSAITTAMDLEKAVEQRIYMVLERTQKVAQVPTDKLSEHANSFLDIANAVFDRLIGMPAEYEDPISTVGQRVTRLTKRIVTGLSTRAHNDVIDPCARQIRGIVDQLSQKLALAELVRQRRDWAFDKVGQVSSSLNESVNDVRNKIENEANRLNIRPEKILMESIRRTSAKLTENMEKFREKTSKLLNGGLISSRLEAAAQYVEHLDTTFSEADNIFQLKDEIIDEAQHRLTEVAQLVSQPFIRSSVSIDSASTDDGPLVHSSENSPVDNSPVSSDIGED